MSISLPTVLGCGLGADDIDCVVDDLALSVPAALGEAAIIAEITALERLKRAIAARQARLSVAFDESRRARQVEDGVAAHKIGRGVSDQIALARRQSPHRGGQHLGLAKALVHEMPCTLAALGRGDVSEWGATVIARETAVLTVEHRREVDARLVEVLSQQGVSEKQLGDAARALAHELDPRAAAKRAAKAESERCVTLRPAPDTMTYLTALLPVASGVGVYAQLDRAARAAAAAGDPRGRGQVMADELVRLATAREGAAAPTAGLAAGAVVVNLVMTNTSLLGEDETPANLLGYGPVPAQVARRLVAAAAVADAAWVRRLYVEPESAQLVAMESRSRHFPSGLAQMLRLRDQVCATPWCDAPIRHTDHAKPHAAGGPTSYQNGQGLCEHCNLIKEDAGFSITRDGDGATWTTPTGHVYRSTPPPLLGLPPPAGPSTTDALRGSPFEQRMRTYVLAA